MTNSSENSNQNSDEDTKTFPTLEATIEGFSKKIDELTSRAGKHREGMEQELHALKEALKRYEAHIRARGTEYEGILEEQSEELERLKKLLEKLLVPPHCIVTFIGFIGMKKANPARKNSREVPFIEVKDASGKICRVVYVAEKPDVKELRYGQMLVVQGNSGQADNVLEALDQFKTEGVMGNIVEAVGNDQSGARFIVRCSENATPFVAHAIAGIDAEELQKDRRVIVDEAAKLIIEVLPPQETSHNYLIGEAPKVKFDDIGGMHDIKRRIIEKFIHPMLFPKTSKKMEEPRPRGATIQGGPGLGKTMLGKAMISETHLVRCRKLGLDPQKEQPVCYVINGPEMLDKYVGEAERKIRELFEEAKRRSKDGTLVAIIIDEAESLLGIRGSGISSDVEKTIVPMFTSQMQGLEESGDENIVVILLSNLAHNIDGAVKRPGRCDFIITVSRPDKEGARQILERYLKPTWDQLHPKYRQDVYYPKNRHGEPRTDKDGREASYQFRCDAERVRDYLISKTLERIYDQPHKSVIVKINYVNEKKEILDQVIRYPDLVSGALLENIVARAKVSARSRYIRSLEKKGIVEKADEYCDLSIEDLKKRGVEGIEPLGVQLVDMLESVESAFKEIHVPNGTGAIRHWLLIENLAKGLDVVGYNFERNPNEVETD